MSYYLFLDDVRVPNKVTWVDLPPANWTIVRDFDSFVSCIRKNGVPHTASFDHDLSYLDNGKTSDYSEKTGYDCSNWLIEYCLKLKLKFPENIHVHSHNPVGADRIRLAWKNCKENESKLRNIYN